MPAPGATGPTPERLALAAKVARLRAKGWTHAAVAERLGLSYSYASQLATDPDGAKARARKESYAQPCPECGAPMNGSDGPSAPPTRCAACLWTRGPDVWTADEVLRAFRRFRREMGRSPSVNDNGHGLAPSVAATLSRKRLAEVRRAVRAAPLPSLPTVLALFGSWNAALDAAGVKRCPVGAPAHRGKRRRRVLPS